MGTSLEHSKNPVQNNAKGVTGGSTKGIKKSMNARRFKSGFLFVIPNTTVRFVVTNLLIGSYW
jgi:hypothetical protein